VVWGYFNRFAHFRIYFEAMAAAAWVLPGAAMLTASLLWHQRRRWAVAMAMAALAAQIVAASAGLAAFCMLSPVSPIPIILCLAWLAAAVQLLVLIWRLRDARSVASRGFEAVMDVPMA